MPVKFCCSVGDADAETVMRYVCKQQIQQTSLNEFPNLELTVTI